MNINNTKWIEVYTKNGYRKLLNIAEITNVSERSNGTSVVCLRNNETIFAIDSYDSILNKIQSTSKTTEEKPLIYEVKEF